MKVLTIKQPYASLIVNEYKKYEFRSWKTNYRGKVLIHAGLSTDKKIDEFNKYNLEYIKGYFLNAALFICLSVVEYNERELKIFEYNK